APAVRSDEPPNGEGRQRLFDALATALRAACRGGRGSAPLLLVLDDAQWCDRETLHFVHYLVRTSSDVALLVVATVRREDLDEAHPARQLLTALGALDRVVE